MIIKDGWMYPENVEELQREFGLAQPDDELRYAEDGHWNRNGAPNTRYGGNYFDTVRLPYRRRVSESSSPLANHFI